MTEELYINGEAVDLKPDAATTLNYKSNLLGDISKITSSNSQTIQCPKTPRNRKIFDNPGAPAYVSDKRCKHYSARLIRNGVEVVKVGYAVLLSAAEHYEIGLYWGIMANFQAWVDRAAKLNELDGTEALAWNASIVPTVLSDMKSRGYGYAQYDCGVTNTDLVNIHPSATAWWILHKIAAQAGFTIEIPSQYEEVLKILAIPCLHKNVSVDSWRAERSTMIIESRNILEFISTPPSGHIISYRVSVFQAKSVTQRRNVYLGETANWQYYAPNGGGTGLRTISLAEFATLSIKTVDIRIDATSVPVVYGTTIRMYVRKDGEERYNQNKPYKKWDITNNRIVTDEIDCTTFDYYIFVIHNPVREEGVYKVDMQITPHAEDVLFPSVLRIAPNLPEITQIDFIKALCAMFGIFVVPDPTNANNMKFVSFAVLQANKRQAYDWSDKLSVSNQDEPKTAEFKVNDYCRNNYFKYKEDETVATDADGNLTIASEVLEKEKTVITLPFAASDGSKIPHYKANDDGTGVDTVRVKDRIMRLVNDGTGRASLTFKGMTFDALLSGHYKSLSRMLNSAIAITEAIMLDEYELKSLDYTIPFYLRQYGKYYGIISIQSTAGKACEVKAVQLPETVIEEDEPIDPSLITNLISVREELTATYITARYPLASNIMVKYDEYLIGDPTPYPRSLIFPKGKTEISTGPKSRIYERTELTSLTPSSDDMYNYIISKETAANE